MNILFLARRFYPEIGGVEKHVMEVSKRLIQKGHQVTIISEGTNDSLPHETLDEIEIYRIFVGSDDPLKKFRIWKSLGNLKKVLEWADVVHCHDVFFWYLPFRFIFPQKPVYTTFHGYESYPITKKAIRVRNLSEKLSWGNICIGDFIKKWYGTTPTYVSYGAVSLPASQSDKKIQKESAVFIGRLDDQTSVLEYVKAIKLLKKSYPQFAFLVVGDGEQKKLIEKKVKTLGFQKNPEKYFNDYHFAFVSRYLTILEAFAAKKLVIAVYDNPVKEDYLRMTPYAQWIVIEKTPEKIAERVVALLQNPKKESEMINAAYLWVTKQSWEKMVNMYLALWSKTRI